MKKSTYAHKQTLLLGGLFVIIILVLVVSSYLVRSRNIAQTSFIQAQEYLTLQSDNLAFHSSYENNRDVTFFTMTSGDVNTRLYRLKADNEQNVLGFLSQDPQYEAKPGVMASLIPDAPQNIRLIETVHDQDQSYLLSNDV